MPGGVCRRRWSPCTWTRRRAPSRSQTRGTRRGCWRSTRWANPPSRCDSSSAGFERGAHPRHPASLLACNALGELAFEVHLVCRLFTRGCTWSRLTNFCRRLLTPDTLRGGAPRGIQSLQGTRPLRCEGLFQCRRDCVSLSDSFRQPREALIMTDCQDTGRRSRLRVSRRVSRIPFVKEVVTRRHDAAGV